MDPLRRTYSSNKRLLAALSISLVLHVCLFGFLGQEKKTADPKRERIPPTLVTLRILPVPAANPPAIKTDTSDDRTEAAEATQAVQADIPAGLSDQAALPKPATAAIPAVQRTAESVSPAADLPENTPSVSPPENPGDQSLTGTVHPNETATGREQTDIQASSADENLPSREGIEDDAPQPSWTRLTEGRALPLPEYPAAAKRFGYEGTVRISLIIADNGDLKEANLLESSGHGILDRETLRTIRSSWSFHPPGREIEIVKDFVFRLQK